MCVCVRQYVCVLRIGTLLASCAARVVRCAAACTYVFLIYFQWRGAPSVEPFADAALYLLSLPLGVCARPVVRFYRTMEETCFCKVLTYVLGEGQPTQTTIRGTQNRLAIRAGPVGSL